jgi:peptide-methionine (S)-S-oxide reductase
MKSEEIVLGGGCFWCTEAVINTLRGVVKVTPGYAGGFTDNPTYRQVCDGATGHAEVVRVEYEPETISLEDLLEVFFLSHDPTSVNRQGADVGTQYRSVVLYTSEEQHAAIESFIEGIKGDYDKPVVTEVKSLEGFYPAEEHHQRYYERNPNQPYCRAIISPKLAKLSTPLHKYGDAPRASVRRARKACD